MKKVIFTITLVVACVFLTPFSQAQFTFSVHPGIQLNSAAFGFKVSKFVPYAGLQILGGSSSLTEAGKKFDYNIGDIVSYENDYKFSGTIYIPVLGTKYFFMERNKLKAFGNICLSKFFLSGKITDSTDPSANSQLDEYKKTGIWAGQIGFGTEYFFDDNFSIGGEFGFRMLHLKYKEVSQDQIYNPNTGDYVPCTTTYDYRVNVNPTYIKFSLNFYFKK